MSWGVVAVGIGSAVVGGMAANSAANKQAGSAREATEAQERSMERQIALQEPWRQGGGLGLNALLYGLGLSPGGTFTPGAGSGAGGVGGSGPGGSETPEQIRERLTPQYVTTAQTPVQAGGGGGAEGENAQWFLPGSQPMTTERRIDEAALSTAVRAEVARQQAAEAARVRTATTTAKRDPNYGNLLRDFSMADFQRDPGHVFRQEEGEKGLMRAAAAAGGLGSGRYLKDAMRLNSGLAAQEYGDAYNRYGANQSNRYNRLAAMAGVGQTATNQVGSAVSQFGQQAGANAIGAGNARAAGTVGVANAIGGGVSQGVSAYQNNQLMNRFFPQGGAAPTAYGGGSGFGTGSQFGNQDYGTYF